MRFRRWIADMRRIGRRKKRRRHHRNETKKHTRFLMKAKVIHKSVCCKFDLFNWRRKSGMCAIYGKDVCGQNKWLPKGKQSLYCVCIWRTCMYDWIAHNSRKNPPQTDAIVTWKHAPHASHGEYKHAACSSNEFKWDEISWLSTRCLCYHPAFHFKIDQIACEFLMSFLNCVLKIYLSQ